MKKFVPYVLAVLCCLSLTACGQSGQSASYHAPEATTEDRVEDYVLINDADEKSVSDGSVDSDLSEETVDGSMSGPDAGNSDFVEP